MTKFTLQQLKQFRANIQASNYSSVNTLIKEVYGENTDTAGTQSLLDILAEAIRSKEMVQIGIMRKDHFIDSPETSEEGDRPIYARIYTLLKE